MTCSRPSRPPFSLRAVLWRARPAVVLLLTVAIGTLGALAFASPADPLWIGGVFDAADADDALLAAGFTEGIDDAHAPDPSTPLLLRAGAATPSRSACCPRSPRSVRRGRSPPAP